MTTILALIGLLTVGPAKAELLYCDDQNVMFGQSTVCMVRDQGMAVTPRHGEPVASGMQQPKCDDGYELVLAPLLSPNMRAMCARDLREPK
jgi:hypothetical protein